MPLPYTPRKAAIEKPMPSAWPPGLPTSVRIYEVGPRDGLQAETAVIPTETKAQFIERLVAALSEIWSELALKRAA